VAVAFVWSTLGGYLPRLVAAAGERHPAIELAVSQVTFREILPALRRGDVDVVIGRATWESSEMVERTLRLEPTVVAVPVAHLFAARERISLAEFAGEPMVALERSLLPAAYDGLLAAVRARGYEPKIVQHARSPAEAIALAAAAVGLYRLPASAAMPHPGVVYCELDGSPTPLVLLHQPSPARAVRTIADLAFELFSDASDASNDAPPALVPVSSAG